jgi:uncharacterized protein (UPF0332 family)
MTKERIVKINGKGYYALPGETDDDVRARHKRINIQQRTMHSFTAEEVLAVDKLRRAYTEARSYAEFHRASALAIERELNTRGVFVDARQSYVEQERILAEKEFP